MIFHGIFHVPRDADGQFVKVGVRLGGAGIKLEPSQIPDIHTTREMHAIKQIADTCGTPLGLHWGKFHEDPRLNGETFFLKRDGQVFDTHLGRFVDQIGPGCLFNSWDLPGVNEGQGSQGWKRLLPAMQGSSLEPVTGADVKTLKAELFADIETIPYSRLEARLTPRDDGRLFDAFVEVMMDNEPALVACDYKGVQLDDVEHIADFIRRDFPGATVTNHVTVEPSAPAP